MYRNIYICYAAAPGLVPSDGAGGMHGRDVYVCHIYVREVHMYIHI